MLKSIEEIKKAATEGGAPFWFSPGAVKTFNSRISPRAYPTPGGAFFVSSEKRGEDDPRRYSVRYCTDGGEISTVAEFMAYTTGRDAHKAASALARAAREAPAPAGNEPLTGPAFATHHVALWLENDSALAETAKRLARQDAQDSSGLLGAWVSRLLYGGGDKGWAMPRDYDQQAAANVRDSFTAADFDAVDWAAVRDSLLTE